MWQLCPYKQQSIAGTRIRLQFGYVENRLVSLSVSCCHMRMWYTLRWFAKYTLNILFSQFFSWASSSSIDASSSNSSSNQCGRFLFACIQFKDKLFGGVHCGLKNPVPAWVSICLVNITFHQQLVCCYTTPNTFVLARICQISCCIDLIGCTQYARSDKSEYAKCSRRRTLALYGSQISLFEEGGFA